MVHAASARPRHSSLTIPRERRRVRGWYSYPRESVAQRWNAYATFTKNSRPTFCSRLSSSSARLFPYPTNITDCQFNLYAKSADPANVPSSGETGER